jgi:hypothetical protein
MRPLRRFAQPVGQRRPVLFAADSIRQPSRTLFPVAHPDFDYSLIGSVSFADWSLHCAEDESFGAKSLSSSPSFW